MIAVAYGSASRRLCRHGRGTLPICRNAPYDAGPRRPMPPDALLCDIGRGPGIHAERMIAAVHRVKAHRRDAGFPGGRARSAYRDRRTSRPKARPATGSAAKYSLCLRPSFMADSRALRRHGRFHHAANRRALNPGGRLFLGMKTGTGDGCDHLGRFYTLLFRGGASSASSKMRASPSTMSRPARKRDLPEPAIPSS